MRVGALKPVPGKILEFPREDTVENYVTTFSPHYYVSINLTRCAGEGMY